MGKSRVKEAEPSGFHVEKKHWRGRPLGIAEVSRIEKIMDAIPYLRSYSVERLVICSSQTDERVANMPRQHRLKQYRILAVDGAAACRIADDSKYQDELALGHHREGKVSHLPPVSKTKAAA